MTTALQVVGGGCFSQADHLQDTMARLLSQILVLFCLISKYINAQLISTHVLDMDNGIPCANVKVDSSILQGSQFNAVYSTQTDSDGRAGMTDPNKPPQIGVYKLHYNILDYFNNTFNQSTFFPYAEVQFKVEDVNTRYEITILLNKYSFTTSSKSVAASPTTQSPITTPTSPSSASRNVNGWKTLMMLVTLLTVKHLSH